jgi:hypothetical protein
LATGQTVNLVIIAKDGDIWISPGGVEQVIPSNACHIAIAGKDDHI